MTQSIQEKQQRLFWWFSKNWSSQRFQEVFRSV